MWNGNLENAHPNTVYPRQTTSPLPSFSNRASNRNHPQKKHNAQEYGFGGYHSQSRNTTPISLSSPNIENLHQREARFSSPSFTDQGNDSRLSVTSQQTSMHNTPSTPQTNPHLHNEHNIKINHNNENASNSSFQNTYRHSSTNNTPTKFYNNSMNNVNNNNNNYSNNDGNDTNKTNVDNFNSNHHTENPQLNRSNSVPLNNSPLSSSSSSSSTTPRSFSLPPTTYNNENEQSYNTLQNQFNVLTYSNDSSGFENSVGEENSVGWDNTVNFGREEDFLEFYSEQDFLTEPAFYENANENSLNYNN